MKQFLDVSAAARFLNLAPQTLNKLRCVGGSPPFYKAGRRVLYERTELEQWVLARRQLSTSDRHSPTL